jgi:hypothetical protein
MTHLERMEDVTASLDGFSRFGYGPAVGANRRSPLRVSGDASSRGLENWVGSSFGVERAQHALRLAHVGATPLRKMVWLEASGTAVRA